jgi:DegV family protein with EDD domain
MYRRVAIITDSAASLPAEVAARSGIIVVPQGLTLAGRASDEEDIPPEQLAAALRAGAQASTSPPPAPAFFWAYQDAIAGGAEEIVSLHVSERLSATCEMARVAAAQVRVPVRVIDSGTLGMSLGFAVVAAADASERGAGPEEVLSVIQRRLAGSLELMYVDTLEYLRRGGRIGAARAWLGTALGIKPLLGLKNGEVAPVERIRGDDKAIARLADLARAHAGRHLVDIAVEHYDAAGPAMRLATRLQAQIPFRRTFYLSQISSVLGVHCGPGSVGVAVSLC